MSWIATSQRRSNKVFQREKQIGKQNAKGIYRKSSGGFCYRFGDKAWPTRPVRRSRKADRKSVEGKNIPVKTKTGSESRKGKTDLKNYCLFKRMKPAEFFLLLINHRSNPSLVNVSKICLCPKISISSFPIE